MTTRAEQLGDFIHAPVRCGYVSMYVWVRCVALHCVALRCVALRCVAFRCVGSLLCRVPNVRYSRTNPPVGGPRKELADPIKSPTMAGGLFSIDRAWFWESGSYDDQMEGWGGENIEMSFRLWQCGGSIEIVPCSVVGHIFRKKNPSPFKKSVILILRHNLKRLAAVWMDEYADIFYSQNHGARNEPTGNISSRLALRQTCKSFKWCVNVPTPHMHIHLLTRMPAHARSCSSHSYVYMRVVVIYFSAVQCHAYQSVVPPPPTSACTCHSSCHAYLPTLLAGCWCVFE